MHPQGAYVVPSASRSWYGSTRRPASLAGLAGRSRLPFQGRQYRYTERRIHETELLYALGWFKTLRPPSASEQTLDRMKEVLSAWKADPVSLLQRFDRNNDGRLDQDEWERARQEAEKEARRYTLKEYDDTATHIMAKPDQRNQTYIISTRSPDQLAKKFKRRMWISILVFFAALVGVGLLLGQS